MFSTLFDRIAAIFSSNSSKSIKSKDLSDAEKEDFEADIALFKEIKSLKAMELQKVSKDVKQKDNDEPPHYIDDDYDAIRREDIESEDEYYDNYEDDDYEFEYDDYDDYDEEEYESEFDFDEFIEEEEDL